MAPISDAYSGYTSTHLPVRKNVAGIPLPARVWRIDGTASALAPASKVSATTFSLVGSLYHCVPASELGMPGTVGEGSGPRVGGTSRDADADGRGGGATGELVRGSFAPPQAEARRAHRRT